MRKLSLLMSCLISLINSETYAAVYNLSFEGYQGDTISSTFGSFTTADNSANSSIVDFLGTLTLGHREFRDYGPPFELVVIDSVNPIFGPEIPFSAVRGGTYPSLSLKFHTSDSIYDLEASNGDVGGAILTGSGRYDMGTAYFSVSSMSPVPLPASLPVFGTGLLVLTGLSFGMKRISTWRG